jgi:hypothetical protein
MLGPARKSEEEEGFLGGGREEEESVVVVVACPLPVCTVRYLASEVRTLLTSVTYGMSDEKSQSRTEISPAKIPISIQHIFHFMVTGVGDMFRFSTWNLRIPDVRVYRLVTATIKIVVSHHNSYFEKIIPLQPRVG